ncbi:hypothetical protein [Microbacterium pumilum]|uniref:Uncharacterized protein n=1 Tax=Microbacterium pumilum TaxID=344165 RepID=A0ABN2STF8_9MICO
MTKRRVQIAALALAVLAAVVLLVVPTYESVTVSSDGGEISTSLTMLQAVGPWIFVVLLVPVLATAVPVFARGRAWSVLSMIGAIVLSGFVILSLLTIGMFFVPAAIASVVAACLPARGKMAAVV